MLACPCDATRRCCNHHARATAYFAKSSLYPQLVGLYCMPTIANLSAKSLAKRRLAAVCMRSIATRKCFRAIRSSSTRKTCARHVFLKAALNIAHQIKKRGEMPRAVHRSRWTQYLKARKKARQIQISLAALAYKFKFALLRRRTPKPCAQSFKIRAATTARRFAPF